MITISGWFYLLVWSNSPYLNDNCIIFINYNFVLYFLLSLQIKVIINKLSVIQLSGGHCIFKIFNIIFGCMLTIVIYWQFLNSIISVGVVPKLAAGQWKKVIFITKQFFSVFQFQDFFSSNSFFQNRVQRKRIEAQVLFFFLFLQSKSFEWYN